MAGKILYLSHLENIIANSYLNYVNTNVWIKLLNLGNFKISNKKKKIKENNNNNTNKDGTAVILTLDIPVQYIEKEYYCLVDDLMRLDPPALAFGIYVEHPLEYISMRSQGKVNKIENKNGEMIDIFTSHKKKLVNIDGMDKIEQGYYGNLKALRDVSYNDKIVLDIMDLNRSYLPIFITNPGPGFIISENCKVLVLYHQAVDEVIKNNIGNKSLG